MQNLSATETADTRYPLSKVRIRKMETHLLLTGAFKYRTLSS